MADTATERTVLHASIMEYQQKIFQAMHAPELPDLLVTDLTMPQFKVLFLLYMHGGLKMSEIAAGVGRNISTATGLVDRLLEQSFIRREEDPDDRRVVKVSLSERGREFCDSFLQFSSRQWESLLRRLSIEELRLVDEATRLFARVASEEAEDRQTTLQERKTNQVLT